MADQHHGKFKRIVWALAIGQMLTWAGLFYLFPSLLGAWESELGWSKTELAGALTTALLISAVTAPFVGLENAMFDHHHLRLMGDMHGPRRDVEFVDELTSIANEKPNRFTFFHGDVFRLIVIVMHHNLDCPGDFRCVTSHADLLHVGVPAAMTMLLGIRRHRRCGNNET